tara:strand:- start:497 stop:1306 length:810 start_codon:yes stop_codon:yes gene_type:complete
LGPIGIFDSGIGGLTVARAACDLLPNESILYFGDTAHLPYGEKSPELIRKYSTRIALHLVNSGCKAIVVACNSASSNALEQIREAVGPNIPVIDMVHPVVEHLFQEEDTNCVGLIGTRATISSGLYSRAIDKHNLLGGVQINLLSRPTPLLASAIEEGFYNDTIPGAVLEAYLDDGYFDRVDSMILGCTHYPLVRKDVMKLLPVSVDVIDPPLIIAKTLKQKLIDNNILSTDEHSFRRFQVSDLTDNFRLGAQRFFGADIDLEEVELNL